MIAILEKLVSDPSHPAWKAIRYLIVAFVLFVMCSFLYKNGFDKKDIVTIASTILALMSFDEAKSRITKPSV